MNILPMPKQITLDSHTICTMRDRIEWLQDRQLPFEGYQIQIKQKGIIVRYADEHSKWYAQVTLDEILKQPQLSCGMMEDAPHYAYRGVHLDVARYFLPLTDLYHFIDLISRLKLNVLHLHLTDEQGWRIHIPEYPKLTEIGAYRAYSDFGRYKDEKKHGGYYTREELQNVVHYAQKRGIDILPEIEMPGHCSPILAAYPHLSCEAHSVDVKTRGGVYDEVLCAGNEKTFEFLEKVMDECCRIFPYPFLHIGADEAKKAHWRSCPKCQERMKKEHLHTVANLQDYFVNRIQAYLASKGKRTIIYSDGLRMHHSCHDVDVQYWVGDKEQTRCLLEQGSKVIISTHGRYYFDLSYGQTSLKDVYTYDPDALFPTCAQGIMGIEGMLWAEFTPDYATRIHQAFPRLLALSETAWNGCNKEPYEDFIKRCNAFIKTYNIKAAPQSLWEMSRVRRIMNMIAYYYRTMTLQDIRQFIAVLKNEKKEKEENEKIIRNEAQ